MAPNAPPGRNDIEEERNSVAEFGISPEDLRRLVRLVDENGLSELRYEEGDLRITLRTPAHRPAATPMVFPTPLVAPVEDHEADYPRAQAAGVPDAAPTGPAVPTARIEAPVMGVFYRAPAPGVPSLVEVGDHVEVGRPVGVIEAMKVFSEVLSEVAGRVREIPVKNGALVHPHETLIVLEIEDGG